MRSSVALYDRLAPGYEEHFSAPHRRAYDDLAWESCAGAIGPPVPGAPVIDAGCGVGRWARRLAGAGHRVIGIEQSPAMLDHARAAQLGDRVELVAGPMEHVELGAASLGPSGASAVLAMGSLQYTPNPAMVLGRFASWVRPGGLVAVLVDSLVALVIELERDGRRGEAAERLGTRRGVWRQGDQVADLHLFDRDRLADAMCSAGLVDIDVCGLLVGWSILGRERVLHDLRRRPEDAMARERAWAEHDELADLGKQLLALGRRPG